MVTNAKAAQAIAGRFVLPTTLYGLSTDPKPTDVANGSTFYEIDTDKQFWFDFENRTWIDPTAPAADSDDDSGEDDGGEG